MDAAGVVIVVIVVGVVLAGGAWFFLMLFPPRRLAQTSMPTSRPSSAPASGRLSPSGLARELMREYGDEVPAEVLVERARAAGLSASAVDSAIDSIVEARRVKRSHVSATSMRIVDLRGLESVRMRVKGSAHYVETTRRRSFLDTEYLLVREPGNKFDTNAIAVHGRGGRKIGHVSATRAAIMAPILDQIGADGYSVAGTAGSATSIVAWVDLPKADALRAFAKGMLATDGQ